MFTPVPHKIKATLIAGVTTIIPEQDFCRAQTVLFKTCSILFGLVPGAVMPALPLIPALRITTTDLILIAVAQLTYFKNWHNLSKSIIWPVRLLVKNNSCQTFGREGWWDQCGIIWYKLLKTGETIHVPLWTIDPEYQRS